MVYRKCENFVIGVKGNARKEDEDETVSKKKNNNEERGS